MKKSIKAIAAFTAALTMAISCVPTIYAADDVPAVQEEAETEAKTGFIQSYWAGRSIQNLFFSEIIHQLPRQGGRCYFGMASRYSFNHRLFSL